MFGGFVEFSRSCSSGTTKPTTVEAFPSLKLLSENKVSTMGEKGGTGGVNGTMGVTLLPLPRSRGSTNLLGFPVAARLASGLDTGPCSCHPGRVHCLGVCRRREEKTSTLKLKRSLQVDNCSINEAGGGGGCNNDNNSILGQLSIEYSQEPLFHCEMR